MKLTNESLKKLVTEVINAEKARMDAWLQNVMDNFSVGKKAEIAARNEKREASCAKVVCSKCYKKHLVDARTLWAKQSIKEER